jgi:hypothetical protein
LVVLTKKEKKGTSVFVGRTLFFDEENFDRRRLESFLVLEEFWSFGGVFGATVGELEKAVVDEEAGFGFGAWGAYVLLFSCRLPYWNFLR